TEGEGKAMRLNRSILFAATITAAAGTGTAFGQTDTENPPSAPPEAQVMPPPPMQPAPVAVPPPPPPPPVMQPGPVAPPAYSYGRPDVAPLPRRVTWMPSSGIGLGLFRGRRRDRLLRQLGAQRDQHGWLVDGADDVRDAKHRRLRGVVHRRRELDRRLRQHQRDAAP